MGNEASSPSSGAEKVPVKVLNVLDDAFEFDVTSPKEEAPSGPGLENPSLLSGNSRKGNNKWYYFGLDSLSRKKIPPLKSPSPSFQEEMNDHQKRLTSLNLPATTFAPVVHKSKLMGIIERRNSGLDKVSDLDADSFVELFNTAYAHSNEKLDTLVDTQKRIVDQIKDNESQCEKASTAMWMPLLSKASARS